MIEMDDKSQAANSDQTESLRNQITEITSRLESHEFLLNSVIKTIGELNDPARVRNVIYQKIANSSLEADAKSRALATLENSFK